MNDIVAYCGWAERIAICWRQSAEAIIETGRLIAAAKEALEHGEFTAMVETALPFGARTAQMLMAIAADPRLTNPKHVSLLPPHWGTMYELTKLDDKQFEAQVADGTIRPDLERKTVINGARAIMGSRQEPDDSLDYFPTPPWATRALVQHVMPELGYMAKRFASAWEPACGEGHIAEVMAEYADILIASDIHDYGYGQVFDFLGNDLPAEIAVDWIVTNPPFGKKTEAFVLRALELASVGVAMFVRMQWLETTGRYERIFSKTPPTVIAFFAERVPLCKGEWKPDGDTATAYIWLVWRKGKQPQAPFWIPPGCRDELEHPADATRFTSHPVMTERREVRFSGGDLVDASTGEIVTPPNRENALTPAPAETLPESLNLTPDEIEANGGGVLEIPDFLRRDLLNRVPVVSPRVAQSADAGEAG